MEISIADQIALDDALVAPADPPELKMERNVIFDFKLGMSHQLESIFKFKMNNKKHILNLDQFRDILQICPKVGNKKFEEPPLEKEILAFLSSLGHSGEIRKIPTDAMSINASTLEIICLLSSKILRNQKIRRKVVAFAMYYPRFTELVVNFVMDKDPSIPRRNKSLPQSPKENEEMMLENCWNLVLIQWVHDATDYDQSDDISGNHHRTESDDDGDDDFIHQKLKTHDDGKFIHEEEKHINDDTFDL
ncbi:hypothetical protein Tco_0769870 [Tanacetum coccineum]|uniref:Uncharacterized protein n=1 Tax=Tanacetum coccineum TaxID=301880 RepID=A0ABQ4ZAL1_9ASTR